MNVIKKLLPDVAAIVMFVIISFAYFYPADTEGRILAQHDAVAGIGAGREHQEYFQKHGKETRWTNALFGGMPTYQIAPGYDSTRTLSYVENIYKLFLPTYVWYVFVMLLGFYILLRAFNFKVWLSALGAIIWAFSSYFFIIIAAGHIWKFVTLAFIPPTIAGMVLVYRGKWLWGGIVTALFVALQISSNHVQMSYYFLFVMFFMALAYGVMAWREKRFPAFLKQTGVLVVAGLLGVCVNLSNLYHTYQYSKESIRGKSELVKAQSADQTGSGLERSYITQWSYGIGETFSLWVPNVKGGASVPLSRNEKAMEKADPQFNVLYNQLGQYWGEQPGTSGPVYVGAFVMFLFFLGCFLVKGPMKWALVGGTLFSILLSWGKNFMGLTDLFIDYMPMYNKFRAVSSILVIAEFTIPLLAIMALKEVLDRPTVLRERFKAFLASFGLSAGIALLFALFPTAFFSSFVSTSELSALQNAIPQEYLASILPNLEEMRVAIFTADAWRSFFVIMVGVGLLWMYGAGKLKAKPVVALLTVLCLIDMWSVNKRYLYDEQFVEKGAEMKPFLKASQADEEILKTDKTLDYRVLNLTTNTFNENETSYWHKSVGGYHAAKLRRYQEMIEEHIHGEMATLSKDLSETNGDMRQVDGAHFPVLNMLNTRYFICPAQGGGTTAVFNSHALGNAWFVDEVKYVANANEEIDAIHHLDPAHTAVVDKRFAEQVKQADATPDSTAQVKLESYEPNDLTYQVQSQKGGVVVFSEIYYPGWQSFIDGKEVPHGRADYILRALSVPAGTHTVRFVFDPHSLHVTEAIAYAALAILALGALAGLVVSIRRKKGKDLLV